MCPGVPHKRVLRPVRGGRVQMVPASAMGLVRRHTDARRASAAAKRGAAILAWSVLFKPAALVADYTQKPTPGTALSVMPPFHRPRAAVVTTDPLVL